MSPKARPIRFLLEGSAGDPFVIVRSRFWRFNAIGFFDGGEACVVDPGIYPDEIDALHEAVCNTAQNGQPRRVTHVALTHSHHDHIRGWMRFPGARVLFPKVAAEKTPEVQARILATKRKIDEQLAVTDYDFRYPEADDVFDGAFAFRVGALDVEMRFVNGHSNCTSVVLVPEHRTLCTADYLVTPGLPYCRWRAKEFERALAALREWVIAEGVERVLPAHEAPILGQDAILAALDEEAHYFTFLREKVRAEIAVGKSREDTTRRAAAAMGARRGVDIGGRARQDLDNARRVLAEEWPEADAPEPERLGRASTEPGS